MAGTAAAAGTDGLVAATPCACRRIDVHSHFLPEPYRRALDEAGLMKVDGGVPVPPWSAADHLAMMDRSGIATSMLSISSPGLHFLTPQVAVRVARQVNEAAAALCRSQPNRFGAFAVLPLQDVAASVKEIAYALDVLHLDGVGLETNTRGLYLGDPRFAPVFDELERRGVTVFLHPTSPECLEQVGMGFPGPLIEFPFDTVRSVVSLIFSGVLKDRPNIKMILSHGGGALPILMSRIAMVSQVPFVSPQPHGGAAEVMAEVRRLYFDLALSATPLTFRALLEVTDLSHILFGTDYPFAPPPAIAGNTASFGKIMDTLTPDQRAMVEYRNAAALFPRLATILKTAGQQL